ncbi:MAG: caspase family protein [Chitinophagaceae bacterium]|nr:caspase family protein [Chitinophagaceae bacterium]
MPRFLVAFLVLLLFNSRFLKAQNKQTAQNTNGNTYALIVGISSYDLNGIPRLDFAHRDAQEFARFLRSANGGNVPEDNIRLLINEQANYASIYNSLYWLMDTCRKNDLVYFYFSGHGDVENKTVHKLGFLLAANTPRFNYINNAIRIEDVNSIANTISVNKGARVVIITDACRSGNLAGKDNRGNLLVGEQLRLARGNEIRITSCGPDELSNEDERWAGGRGFFPIIW